jgi:multidrug efflux pump subunit AcrA (membrane-fusion protein)
MFKKKRIWLITLIILATSVAVGTFLSRQKQPMQRRPLGGNQKPLNIVTVTNQDISTPIKISGPLIAYNKVELYSEVSGVLQNTPRRFKEGVRYHKGDILIHIDDSVYKNNLLAQKSSLLNKITLLLPDLSIDFPDSAPHWEDYLKRIDLEKPLSPLPEPVTDKERYYIASRDIYNQYYQIKSMEATWQKYRLRAPFNGVVTQSEINPGTLVRVGQKLGEFTSTELYEMEAAVSLFDANRLEVGMKAFLHTSSTTGRFEGEVQRINRAIDRDSMSVKVYIHTSDPRLRDGMYMMGEISGNPVPAVVPVSRDLLIEGDRIFVVKNGILRLQKVTVVTEEGSRVFVRGLPDGIEMVADKREGLREGMPVPGTGGDDGTSRKFASGVQESDRPVQSGGRKP